MTGLRSCSEPTAVERSTVTTVRSSDLVCNPTTYLAILWSMKASEVESELVGVVVLLQAAHRQCVAGPVGDAGGRSPGRGPRGGAGDAVAVCGPADNRAIGSGPASP